MMIGKMMIRAAAGLAACIAAGQAQAVVVPGSTFDFGVAYVATTAANTQAALFNFQVGTQAYYFTDDPGFVGDAWGLHFDLFEEDRGPDAYQLIFYLISYGELFPARDGIDYSGGTFGIGINDAVELDGAYRLTGARMVYSNWLEEVVMEADLLAQSAVSTSTPWNGRFPALERGSIGFADVTGREISSITLRLDVARMAVLPPPSAVPEPASWAMMMLGFGVVGGLARRTRPRQAAAHA